MSASPAPAWSPPPPRDRWGPGRVIALVLGVLLLLPALGLLAGGGVLLWADQSQRDSDGFLLSPTGDVSTDGYALISDRIDLSTDGDWVPVSAALGTAVVRASGSGPDVFIGIGPSAQVRDYLGGVQRAVIDDLGNDGAVIDREVSGGAPAGPPTAQTFWSEQTSGAGRQQLTWEPADGNWTVVVMNADGSAGVSTDLRVGAELPSLTAIAWGVLIGGILLTLVAVLVIVLALRRRGPRGQLPPSAVPATAGPPPAWQPPAPRAAPAGDPASDPARGPSQDQVT
jgi:hypothetical protein